MKRIGLIDAEPQETPAAFVCPHCGKEYKTGAGLRAHVEKEHPQVFDEEDAKCR